MAVQFPARGGGNEALTSDGGSNTFTIPAGAGITKLFVGRGRLCRILVTTAGSAASQFFDDPGIAQGTIVGVVPAAAPVGMQPPIDMPFVNGLVCVNPSGGPAMTVSLNIIG